MGEGRGWQGRRRGNIEEVLKTKVRTIKETETGKKVRRGEEKRKDGRKKVEGEACVLAQSCSRKSDMHEDHELSLKQ